MPTPPPDDGLSASDWSLGERVVLVALLLALLALMVWRQDTRRPDDARNPRDLDVLVVHVGGLRADALTTTQLANDLDFDPAAMDVWVNAFAQGTDALRSARAALEGDLVLDARGPSGGANLAGRLREAGWSTILVEDVGALGAVVGDRFDRVLDVPDALAAGPALAQAWQEAAGRGPVFAFVDLEFGEEPLHSDTTEAYVLQERYLLRVKRIREAVRAVAAATSAPRRGQLVVLLGAGALTLGEHPSRTEMPFDPRLHVPLLMGLRWAEGIPAGEFSAMVQAADLGPTVLDMLDLRARREQREDGVRRAGRSLEPVIHGWKPEPVHDSIVLLGAEHVAIRTVEWKLIAPVIAGGVAVRSGAQLYSLTEDPAEGLDLLAGRDLGPVGERLFGVLVERLPPGDPPR